MTTTLSTHSHKHTGITAGGDYFELPIFILAAALRTVAIATKAKTK
jgi:hypothetical protein